MPRRHRAHQAIFLWVLVILLGFTLRRCGGSRSPSPGRAEDRLLQERLLRQEQIATLEELESLLRRQVDRYQGFLPVTAQALSEDLSPRRRSALLDVGHEAGVRVGQSVVAEAGLIGVVTEVGSRRARVRLADDTAFRVKFRVVRSGQVGIAAGGPGVGTMRPLFQRDTLELRVDDVFVTEGGDGVFPRGILIGRLTELRRPLVSSRIELAQDFRRLRSVIVLTVPPVGLSSEERGR